jgi:branched-chain amino acid aminotransferase
VLDRGFLYGDSIYEVVRTYGGVPVTLGPHLDRLQRSADLLGIRIPVDRRELVARLRDTVAAAGNAESYVRVVVTRGAGEIGLDPALGTDPLLAIIAAPLKRIPPEWQEKGVRVSLVHVGRGPAGSVPGGVKSGNYLANLMALGQAKRAGSEEAILVDTDGCVTEGSTSNFFLARGGRLVTPALDRFILEGITRRIVLRLAREAGLPVDERPVRLDDLRGADEALLTSTLREVVPVVRIDEATVGSGLPGPVALDLLRRFRERVPEGLGWEA